MTHRPFSISSPYGWRNGRFHTGDDYATPQGTPLGSPRAGTAEVHKSNYSYGWQVVIRFPDASYCRLAHLSAILCRTGDKVYAGQHICNSGGAKGVTGSGNSTGAHLHFEMWIGGRHVNPRNYVGGLFHGQEDAVSPDQERRLKDHVTTTVATYLRHYVAFMMDGYNSAGGPVPDTSAWEGRRRWTLKAIFLRK